MVQGDAAPGARPGPLLCAWAVHAFTASGGVVALLAVLSAAREDFAASCLWMLLALFIDSVDGTLARKARVKELIPTFDGRTLDDLIDYLNYVVVPALFLVFADCVPHWGFATLPVLASAYGFSQVDAKTEDDFFLGFPSYWNIVAIYAWTLDVSHAWVAAWLIGLSFAVFVPLKYVYPSHMRFLFWTTNLSGGLWTVVMALAIGFPERLGHLHLVELSLVYPAYYVAISVWLGGLQRKGRRGPRKG